MKTRCQNTRCDYPLPSGQRECPNCGRHQVYRREMTRSGAVSEKRLTVKEAIGASYRNRDIFI